VTLAFLHLRAKTLAAARISAPTPLIDHVEVERLRRHFDAEVRLMRWPARGIPCGTKGFSGRICRKVHR